MKIKKVIINIHNVFTDYAINFTITQGPQIHYLVGNNGSGKTLLLDSLHRCITRDYGNSNFHCDLSVTGDFSIEGIHCDQARLIGDGGMTIAQSQDSIRSGDEKIIDDENKHRSCVYSSVEITFKAEDIKATTALNADSETPRQKSQDLNKLIPQLLVNLEQHDNQICRAWMRNNEGKVVPSFIPGLKLPRFIHAYNKMLDNSKRFKAIQPNNDSFECIFTDSTNGTDVRLDDMSSGEKQIIYRLGFILKDLQTISDGIILIDEPEISLHPKWQLAFKKLLLSIFKDTNVQIIIATHSPYIFGELNSRHEECIKIDKTKSEAKKVELVLSGLNSSPSMNLVNYIAYGIPSEHLHIELYNEIQKKSGCPYIAATDRWIDDNSTMTKENRSAVGGNNFSDGGRHPANETLPTWIRNKLHHPDCLDRKNFDKTDLIQSIDEMINILNQP